MTETNDSTAINIDELSFDNLDADPFNDPEPAINDSSKTRGLDFFKNIPVTVTLEVASTEISLGELMHAGEGSVLELDKLNGEPLDVKVNGSLMGHAEVVIINEKYGLRLTDVVGSPLDSLED